jgi:hypothetical protein
MHPLRRIQESGAATAEQYLTLLADNVTFHGPILASAIEGKDAVAAVFAISTSVRHGRCIAEHKLDEHTTFLRWKGLIDGHEIESLEIIVDDQQGLVVDRTVAFRPLPAIELFRNAMFPLLKNVVPSNAWQYQKASGR